MALRPIVSLLALVAVASPVSANLRLVKQHQGSSCDCMTWKDVYANHGVKCGAGGEFQPIVSKGLSLSLAQQVVGAEFCGKLFERIPDNFCINNDFIYNPSQWCYVSSACSTATPVKGRKHVSVKTCGEGDKMLMDYSFDELYNLTKPDKENLDIGLVAQYAWKYWTADKWPAVESEIMNGPTRSDLKEMVASNKPVFISSTSGHPPFHLVKGNRVEEIHFTSDTGAFNAGRMGAVNEIVCIKGCK